MPKSEYPRYTLEARRLTDIGYLVDRIIAHTCEARVILARLPTLPGDEQWRLMHQFLSRLTPGNSEAERIFRLVRSFEPYTYGFTASGAPLVVHPAAPWPDAKSQKIAEEIFAE